MMRLYAMPGSGNSYKVQLLAHLLGIELDQVSMSALDGSTRTASFREKSPTGKLPLLELEDGRFLPESGAILTYLAEGSPYLPDDRYARARCLGWMFFEQYSHEPVIATSRSIAVYPERAIGVSAEKKQELLDKGNAALAVMETQLQQSSHLVGDQPSIADIALYAYTHDCEKGGFSLSAYPAISAWLERIEDLPDYMEMPQS